MIGRRRGHLCALCAIHSAALYCSICQWTPPPLGTFLESLSGTLTLCYVSVSTSSRLDWSRWLADFQQP